MVFHQHAKIKPMQLGDDLNDSVDTQSTSDLSSNPYSERPKSPLSQRAMDCSQQGLPYKRPNAKSSLKRNAPRPSLPRYKEPLIDAPQIQHKRSFHGTFSSFFSKIKVPLASNGTTPGLQELKRRGSIYSSADESVDSVEESVYSIEDDSDLRDLEQSLNVIHGNGNDEAYESDFSDSESEKSLFLGSNCEPSSRRPSMAVEFLSPFEVCLTESFFLNRVKYFLPQRDWEMFLLMAAAQAKSNDVPTPLSDMVRARTESRIALKNWLVGNKQCHIASTKQEIDKVDGERAPSASHPRKAGLSNESPERMRPTSEEEGSAELGVPTEADADLPSPASADSPPLMPALPTAPPPAPCIAAAQAAAAAPCSKAAPVARRSVPVATVAGCLLRPEVRRRLGAFQDHAGRRRHLAALFARVVGEEKAAARLWGAQAGVAEAAWREGRFKRKRVHLSKRGGPKPAAHRALDRAALCGHLPLLRRFHAEGLPASTDALDFAAEGGHLAAVEFLHYHRREGCTTAAMDRAAQWGHLAVVEFLHRHRSEGCTENALDFAAWGGHLGVIEFLHGARDEGCSFQALDLAALRGHLGVVEWFAPYWSEGFQVDSACDLAAHGGHLAVLEWVHAASGGVGCTHRGEQWAENARRHPAVVRWLRRRVISDHEEVEVLEDYFAPGGRGDRGVPDPDQGGGGEEEEAEEFLSSGQLSSEEEEEEEEEEVPSLAELGGEESGEEKDGGPEEGSAHSAGRGDHKDAWGVGAGDHEEGSSGSESDSPQEAEEEMGVHLEQDPQEQGFSSSEEDCRSASSTVPSGDEVGGLDSDRHGVAIAGALQKLDLGEGETACLSESGRGEENSPSGDDLHSLQQPPASEKSEEDDEDEEECDWQQVRKMIQQVKRLNSPGGRESVDYLV